jgi:hypothetical protein
MVQDFSNYSNGTQFKTYVWPWATEPMESKAPPWIRKDSTLFNLNLSITFVKIKGDSMKTEQLSSSYPSSLCFSRLGQLGS